MHVALEAFEEPPIKNYAPNFDPATGISRVDEIPSQLRTDTDNFFQIWNSARVRGDVERLKKVQAKELTPQDKVFEATQKARMNLENARANIDLMSTLFAELNKTLDYEQTYFQPEQADTYSTDDEGSFPAQNTQPKPKKQAPPNVPPNPSAFDLEGTYGYTPGEDAQDIELGSLIVDQQLELQSCRKTIMETAEELKQTIEGSRAILRKAEQLSKFISVHPFSNLNAFPPKPEILLCYTGIGAHAPATVLHQTGPSSFEFALSRPIGISISPKAGPAPPVAPYGDFHSLRDIRIMQRFAQTMDVLCAESWRNSTTYSSTRLSNTLTVHAAGETVHFSLAKLPFSLSHVSEPSDEISEKNTDSQAVDSKEKNEAISENSEKFAEAPIWFPSMVRRAMNPDGKPLANFKQALEGRKWIADCANYIIEKFQKVWFITVKRWFSDNGWRIMLETPYGRPSSIWGTTSQVLATDSKRKPVIGVIWRQEDGSASRAIAHWCDEISFSFFSEGIRALAHRYHLAVKEKSGSRISIFFPPLTGASMQRKLVFDYLGKNNKVRVREKSILMARKKTEDSFEPSAVLATFWFQDIPGADFEQKVNLLFFGPSLVAIVQLFKDNV